MRPYPLASAELVDDVLATWDRVTETVKARFGGLSADALGWQPGPRAWGVGHCLVHLARTNELYRGALTPALRPRAPSEDGPLRGRWFGRLFTRMVGPGGIKVKSPEILRPRQRIVDASSLETFLAEQHRCRGLFDEGRGLDLDNLRVLSPVASWVKLTAGDAFRVMVAHEERHLAQAVRVASNPDFPG